MVLVTRQNFPYTERVLGAYEETVKLLGDLRNRCHYVSSVAARGIEAAGVQIRIAHGYFVPLDDIRFYVSTHMPLTRAEYVQNSHWWLRFPEWAYSLDITHAQVDPENPLLIVPTSLEEANGIFYRSDTTHLPINGKEAKELLRIWHTAFAGGV